MNTGSQNTASYSVFPANNMPCSIPVQPTPLADGTNWKTFSFRKAATSLYSFMTEVMEQTALRETLQSNIASLQEYFLERLYSLLHLKSIDTSHKITLRLDNDHRLVVCNNHIAKANINQLLDNDPELSALFREMAVQSSALHQMNFLQDLTYAYLTSQEETSGRINRYHLNIKGDMSHFFFTSL